MPKKPKYIPSIGEKFYNLTVIDNKDLYIDRPSGRRTAVLCKCVCGKEKLLELKNFTSKDPKYRAKSCGCNSYYPGQSKHALRGDHPNKINWELWRHYKTNAVKRNLEFELTREKFIELINQNCYYCGTSPELRKRNDVEFYANGVDRIDSSIGYTDKNCIPACKICNNMKWHFTKEDFFKQVKLILEYKNLIK